MKPFEFELASVFRVKERHRDEVRDEFAKAVEAFQILEKRKSELEGELLAAKQRRKSASAERVINVDSLLNTQRFEFVLVREIAEVEEQQRLIEEELEARRLRLVEADREVKMLERLREKKLAAHEKELLRLESLELDEVASRIVQQQRRVGN